MSEQLPQELRLTESELSHLVEVFEATSAGAERLRLGWDTSVDLRTIAALRELQNARREIQDWKNWLAGACV